MGRSYWAMLLGAWIFAGCGAGGDRAGQARDTGAATAHMDSGGMRHMDGGTAGMPMQGMQMMAGMRAHMDSVMRMSPEQMQAMMARHQGVMSGMLDTMGSEMRGMNMPGTPEWNALTDSVKQDLAELPGLKGQELSARVRAHAGRVERLLALHRQMMAK